jgi:hypothetical protein
MIPYLSNNLVGAAVFGVAFLAVMLVVALVYPRPSNFQYTVFRIILAISVAGVAAIIPGLINVTAGPGITAGGALGVFVIVYFWSPARLVIEENGSGGSVNVERPEDKTNGPDDPMARVERSILYAYRYVILNSATMMYFLSYLAEHGEATQDTLLNELASSLKAVPSTEHRRHVLFALSAARFLARKRGTLYHLTALGYRAHTNITHLDDNPPATAAEVDGYRMMIRKSRLICSVFAALNTGSALVEADIKTFVLERYRREFKTAPTDGAVDRVLMNMGETGWIASDNSIYRLTDAGIDIIRDFGSDALKESTVKPIREEDAVSL